MTNTKELRKLINQKGLKLSFVAEKLGLSYFGFMKKVNNENEFKTGEVQMLCDLLEIESLEQKELVFFALKDD